MSCCDMQEALLLELHPKAVATAVRRVRALQELHVTPEELLRVVALVSMWAFGGGSKFETLNFEPEKSIRACCMAWVREVELASH